MRVKHSGSLLVLALAAAGCSGGLPSHASLAGDWTQYSGSPLAAGSRPFSGADRYFAKKNCPDCHPIYNFSGSPDGARPESAVAFNRDNPNVPSDLGVTIAGGSSNNGALYGLTETKKGWKESVLYSFGGSASGDGSAPAGTLIAHTSTDSMFVVTESGGTSGNGTFDVFDENGWQKTFTYSFGGTPDGAAPVGNPVVDKSGTIYGTTESGGAYGEGAVYRMLPKGSGYEEAVGWSFGVEIAGAYPFGGLIMDKKGAIYGTTYEGGSAGEGTVFKLTPSGSTYTPSTIYSFLGAPNDGSRVTAGPCGGPNGSIYGTTEEGGTNNVGTVYKLTPSGSTYKETILWNFGSVAGDGAYPYGGVIVDKKGVIYGTTVAGGASGSSGLGTFFILAPSGSTYKETVYSFTGENGAVPYAIPSVDSKGYLYLTTSAGGSTNNGAVLRMHKPMNPKLWNPSGWTGCS